MARLRKVTEARAVEAYKRSGTPFANTFGDAATVTETIRRLAILDAVNARDRDAADAFQEARAERGDPPGRPAGGQGRSRQPRSTSSGRRRST